MDYRRPPESPFPVPVDDCLSAYRWLLEQGVASSNIVFAGDSAGKTTNNIIYIYIVNALLACIHFENIF